MKKKIIWLLCLFMLSLPLFAQMSKMEMQNMYLTYMRGQGIEAMVDSDGDIAFEYDLSNYGTFIFYIIIFEDDPQFFHILTIDVLSQALVNDQQRREVSEAVIYATGIAKAVKMYLNSSGTNVWASGEVFLASPNGFSFVFPKIMAEFAAAFDAFVGY
ncbi:MAG: hypothetical protein LBI14_10045 [Treponema sp.]|nr:hypothetical protein [Treponema sp.]